LPRKAVGLLKNPLQQPDVQTPSRAVVLSRARESSTDQASHLLLWRVLRARGVTPWRQRMIPRWTIQAVVRRCVISSEGRRPHPNVGIKAWLAGVRRHARSPNKTVRMVFSTWSSVNGLLSQGLPVSARKVLVSSAAASPVMKTNCSAHLGDASWRRA
jgi:hypothetical protein